MRLKAFTQTFACDDIFVISRGAHTHTEIITVEIGNADILGRGECIPDLRYGKTPARKAKAASSKIMLATSPAMAPAIYVAQNADIIDLDGPLLLAEDRDNPIHYELSTLFPPDPALWG